MIVTRIRPVRRRWETGWGDFDQMRSELLRMVDAMGRSFLPEDGYRMFPLVNVSQDTENYYVRAELPGVQASDLEVSTLGARLTIAGKRELPEEEGQVAYHRREREGGAFSRSIQLPGAFDRDKVDAHYEHGILTVTLPRAAADKPRQIAVQGS